MNECNFLKIKSFEIKSFDAIEGRIIGRAAKFNNIDRKSEVIIPTAFDKDLKLIQSGQKSIKIFKEHIKDWGFYADRVWKDGNEALCIDARVPEYSQYQNEVKSWIRDVKSGKISPTLSIGYTVNEFHIKDGIKYLTDISLQEVSVTANPVNPLAIAEFKSLTESQYPIYLSDTYNESNAIELWKEYTCSNDKPNVSYIKGFLYYDQKSSVDDYKSYHYPIIDIINGNPVINSKAVILANHKINSNKSHQKSFTNIDKNAIQHKINNLYIDINKEREKNNIPLLSIPMKKSFLDMIEITSRSKAIQYGKKHIKSADVSNNQFEAYINKIISLRDAKYLDIKNHNNISSSTEPLHTEALQNSSDTNSISNEINIEDFLQKLNKKLQN